MSISKKLVYELLERADIEVNGSRPWDIQVHDDRFYQRVLHQQNLGLGEAYMAGWFDVDAIDEMVAHIISANLEDEVKSSPRLIWFYLINKIFNRQSRSRAYQVGERHYDLGNEFYRAMLDKEMSYTCAYWKEASDLESAQVAKLDLVCNKLQLQPGMKVLDIGCGWGAFARHAAKHYGVSVVGITISQAQYELAQSLCEGLPIELRLQDYRDLNEVFDRIVSLGMFEHVGYKNYPTYMDAAARCLKDDGLFLLHTIGASVSTVHGDPWMSKYIFPNGMLPSIKQIGTAIEGRFVMEDWHNFGADYDKTLCAWHHNFKQAWPELKSLYDENFYRMWTYYLKSCAGSFRSRLIQLWQIVLSKHGIQGGYQSIR